jgi:hypothetical protein
VTRVGWIITGWVTALLMTGCGDDGPSRAADDPGDDGPRDVLPAMQVPPAETVTRLELLREGERFVFKRRGGQWRMSTPGLGPVQNETVQALLIAAEGVQLLREDAELPGLATADGVVMLTDTDGASLRLALMERLPGGAGWAMVHAGPGAGAGPGAVVLTDGLHRAVAASRPWRWLASPLRAPEPGEVERIELGPAGVEPLVLRRRPGAEAAWDVAIGGGWARADDDRVWSMLQVLGEELGATDVGEAADGQLAGGVATLGLQVRSTAGLKSQVWHAAISGPDEQAGGDAAVRVWTQGVARRVTVSPAAGLALRSLWSAGSPEQWLSIDPLPIMPGEVERIEVRDMRGRDAAVVGPLGKPGAIAGPASVVERTAVGWQDASGEPADADAIARWLAAVAGRAPIEPQLADGGVESPAAVVVLTPRSGPKVRWHVASGERQTAVVGRVAGEAAAYPVEPRLLDRVRAAAHAGWPSPVLHLVGDAQGPVQVTSIWRRGEFTSQWSAVLADAQPRSSLVGEQPLDASRVAIWLSSVRRLVVQQWLPPEQWQAVRESATVELRFDVGGEQRRVWVDERTGRAAAEGDGMPHLPFVLREPDAASLTAELRPTRVVGLSPRGVSRVQLSAAHQPDARPLTLERDGRLWRASPGQVLVLAEAEHGDRAAAAALVDAIGGLSVTRWLDAAPPAEHQGVRVSVEGSGRSITFRWVGPLLVAGDGRVGLLSDSDAARLRAGVAASGAGSLDASGSAE